MYNFTIFSITVCLSIFTTFAVNAAPCDTAEHRAFDFWLGEWEVRTPDGKLAGINQIKGEYDGCMLHERYTTGGNFSGESLNIYDAGRKVWHQSWVDNAGTLLLLEGGIRDSKMVLEGQTTATDMQIIRHRITWTPNTNRSVRQLWESTNTEGQWVTAFVGMYTRK